MMGEVNDYLAGLLDMPSAPNSRGCAPSFLTGLSIGHATSVWFDRRSFGLV